jgi:thiol:disulfide interchange protein/DsbC/DsbD-like thiol-disulfide interchange protein
LKLPTTTFPRDAVLLLASAWLPALAAAALPPAEAATEQVTARLVAGVQSVQPGQPLQLGLQQRIADHWHTYWLNPGDSGLAPSIEWTLPAGASAGPIEWPVPSRFPLGPLVNYGYAGEVTLLDTLQVPASLREGERFEVQAKVDWLVCKDVCIPQQVVLGLSLPVRATAAAPGPDAALLQQARSRLPVPGPGVAQWHAEGADKRVLSFAAPQPALPEHDDAYFYAARWGRLAHAAPQALQRGDTPAAWRLGLPLGEDPPAADEPPAGVLVLSQKGRPVAAYALGDVTAPAPAAPAPTPASNAGPAASPSLALALGFALLGGLVLNLMPCVFPVLTIKALSLLQTAQGSRRTVRLHGLAYTAGVLLSFAALAGLLVALKAGGDQVGWGFQFQSPAFVLLLALLMFGMGLGLSGVVTVGASVSGVGSGLAARGGFSGSFFTGVLATVVATPCTAPFMGAAIGYALTQPAAVTFAVFLCLGLGLALPYLLLCEWPALQRRLPRPGAWMERVKQGLAFPLYASAAWLAWVLTQQAGSAALAMALACAIALAFAAWLQGSTRGLAGARARQAATAAAALLAVASVVSGPLAVGAADTGPTPATAEAAAPGRHGSDRGWEPYSPERLEALLAQGKPVFVNLTADWCLTCLVNERVALGPERVDEAFRSAGVTRLKGDWTRRDERITRLLEQHGRSGVPLYLFYPAGADNHRPTVLPQLLSPDLVLTTLGGGTATVVVPPADALLAPSSPTEKRS